jgi:hypothetical protein
MLPLNKNKRPVHAVHADSKNLFIKEVNKLKKDPLVKELKKLNLNLIKTKEDKTTIYKIRSYLFRATLCNVLFPVSLPNISEKNKKKISTEKSIFTTGGILYDFFPTGFNMKSSSIKKNHVHITTNDKNDLSERCIQKISSNDLKKVLHIIQFDKKPLKTKVGVRYISKGAVVFYISRANYMFSQIAQELPAGKRKKHSLKIYKKRIEIILQILDTIFLKKYGVLFPYSVNNVVQQLKDDKRRPANIRLGFYNNDDKKMLNIEIKDAILIKTFKIPLNALYGRIYI